MSKERIEQIKLGLSKLGTEENVYYTNQEIVDKLIEFQSSLAKGVFEKTHAQNLRERDILIHFESFAKEYGLEHSEEFLRFKNNMRQLGYTIGSFIKGLTGERNVRKSLKLLSYDKNVKILFNIQLEDEDTQTEYDAIVIAPYGLFVIEVKNWDSIINISKNGILSCGNEGKVLYDIPGKMSIKEALLRKYLDELFPKQYNSILLFLNEIAKISDEYNKIPISIGSGISYFIKEYRYNGCFLDESQILEMEKRIISHHKEQKTLSPVDCKQIVEDYAFLISKIESNVSNIECTTVKDELGLDAPISFKNRFLDFFTNVDMLEIGKKAGVFAAILTSSLLLYKNIKK